MSGDDTFTSTPHRSPSSVKQSLELRADTPRTIVPTRKQDDDEETYSLGDEYGMGIAQTTDDARHATIYESESSEQSIDEPRAATFPLNIPNEAIPADIDRRRALSPSVASTSNFSQSAQSSSGSSNSRMPEFFGHTVFQTVLHNPTIAHQLLKFGQSRLCGENMDFLARVNRYHGLLNEVTKAIAEIHKEFLSTSAPSQVNLAESVLMSVKKESKTAIKSTLPLLESIFLNAQSDIERLVYTDVYPKFVRHQMSVSAAKALGSDRGKYAGLGDCFVLTDPAKADNPIVYASDGFVNVTGYSRNEIIPRNCRFLQSRHTDRATVRRLRSAIDNREESVELLLNQKKNGEPFWNLLYMTPLFDQYGKLVFFLGGQINCSTTIHNASDVLRILAQSRDVDENATPRAASPEVIKQPRSRNFLSVFRSNSSPAVVPQHTPGMENTLLDRLEDMPLKSQMSTFYTAYSNVSINSHSPTMLSRLSLTALQYIIINYSTFLVTFVSAGIVDLLFPIKAKSAYLAQGVGTDVFKFLANHGTGSISWDMKSAVKGALRAGRPISLDLKLCARPYMGFERFVTHWTPMKDESGAVAWIALTLGNEQRA